MIMLFTILILGLFGAAFFAGTETSFVALLGKGEDSNRLPKDIRRWLKKPQTIFSVTLIGTNVSHILASSIATKIALDIFPTRGELYSMAIMTAMILVFSEVIPKSRALSGPESFARFASKPFGISAIILKPLSKLADKMSAFLVGLSRHIVSPSQPPDWKEFELVAKEGELKLGSNRNALLTMVFDLAKKTAFDLMTPIGEIPNKTPNNTDTTAFERQIREAEKRFYIVEDEEGRIEGVVDMALKIAHGGFGLFEPLYVPENTPILRLFAEMRDSNAEFAFVVDEHGNITGGIVREEIADLFSGVRRKGRGIRGKTLEGYIVEGSMEIDELGSLLGTTFPEGPYRSVAGFLEEISGEIPELNRPIKFGGFSFIPLKKTPRKLLRVRVEPLK